MKILSYNVRGLGKKAKRREIRELLRKHRIDFCCIQETKMSNIGERFCKSVWGDQNIGWAAMDAEGSSGGILSIWNDNIFSLTSSWFTRGVLITNGFLREDGQQVCVLNIYAPCSASEKKRLWDVVTNIISQQSSRYICVAGDFNAIRFESGRVGRGALIDHREISTFDNFIVQANLVEIPLIGRTFTWYRKDGSCKSKLDRMLVNEDWLNTWPHYVIKSSGRTLSDNCPIFMEASVQDWGPKPFRFINSWTTHPNFIHFINIKWNEYRVEGWAGFRLKEKLKLMKADLREWNKSVFGIIEKQIESTRLDVEALDKVDDTFGLETEEIIRRNKCTAELTRAMIWWDSFMSQKARIKWLNEGDVNSSFFHSWINKRAKQRGIEAVLVDNRWLETAGEIKEAATPHFKNQFKAKRLFRPQIPMDLFEKRLSNVEIEVLDARFTEDEIKEAIWGCDSNKSPGPDGFSFAFIKENWCNMKGEVMQMMEEFFEHGRIVKGLNSSFIVLIPKKEGSKSFEEYRPISLIGCLYKIIAKTLANRLSKVLDVVISENQSAFVGGRQILDGIVILNEMMDEAKKRKIKRAFFKVDFAKAYDTVDWDFLDDMLKGLNFSTKWRKWVRECVASASSSVLINGSPSDVFNHERGIRQGDPMSPFLFLIVAEGLCLLVKRAV